MTYTLYGYHASDNCYKIKLLLNQLEIPFHYKEVDIVKGESRTEEFLPQVNPVGCIPVLAISSTATLTESNAILIYLAEDTPFLPKEKFKRAQVFQWLFFEQYKHEPNIATLRFWQKCLNRKKTDKQWKDKMEEKFTNGEEALRIMNDHLMNNAYFVGNSYTIADICLYAYTHKAHEAGFNLNSYPHILQWFKRIEKQDNYVKFE
ncbi:glutathione S-transferase domain protein [Mycotypha africana]|uniref:glutathione S-transferase domain protein n=1 Tax=Mycotypha africana TaxID=64632 RepID=UPI00230034C3|nr:glutathione S-transferase domain protein [Mycotypha africana]KAI8968253.1 glutathione S-transferase domain protein [Mycotypha africana]